MYNPYIPCIKQNKHSVQELWMLTDFPIKVYYASTTTKLSVIVEEMIKKI